MGGETVKLQVRVAVPFASSFAENSIVCIPAPSGDVGVCAQVFVCASYVVATTTPSNFIVELNDELGELRQAMMCDGESGSIPPGVGVTVLTLDAVP